jgi:hypothetical protein
MLAIARQMTDFILINLSYLFVKECGFLVVRNEWIGCGLESESDTLYLYTIPPGEL